MSEDDGSTGPEIEQADDLFGRWLAHHARQVSEDEKGYAAEAAGTTTRLGLRRDRHRAAGPADPDDPAETTSTGGPADVAAVADTEAPLGPLEASRTMRSTSGEEPDWPAAPTAVATEADEPAPVPARKAPDLDWLAIVRDPGARYTSAPQEPATAAEPARPPEAPVPDEPPAAAETAVVVQPEPAVVEPADEEPAVAPAETTRPLTWVDRLRGTASARPWSRTEPTPEPERREPASEAPAEPGPDWRSRFRDAVIADEAAEAATEPVPVVVHRIAQSRSLHPAPVVEPVVHRVAQSRKPAQPAAAAPAPQPAEVVAPAAGPPSTAAVAWPTETAKQAEDAVRAAPITSMPDVHEFRPRRAARRLVTLLLGLGMLLTAFLVYLTYQEPSQSAVVLSAVVAVVTALVWALKAATEVTTLVVREGILEVTRGGKTHEVDLTSTDSPVELVGEPGKRGWKAVLASRGTAPIEVTSAHVDPVELTRVVRYHQPGEPTA